MQWPKFTTQHDEMLVIYAMIGGLVALAIALYYNAQQKATRLSQLHKERRVTEELESTQQQLKIKEKLYEGSTPSILPSRPPQAS